MKIYLFVLLVLTSVFATDIYSQTYRDRFASSIKLKQDVDSDYTLTINSPTLAGSSTLTLPTSAGTDTYYLSTDGSGVLSWTSVTVASNPIGIEGSVQYNLADSLGGDSLFVFVDSLNSLYVGLPPASDTSSVVAPIILVGKDGSVGSLLIRSVNGSETYLVLRPTSTMIQDLVFEMPADNGDLYDALVTNGSGVLSWGGTIQVGPISQNNTNNDNTVDNDADNGYIGGGDGNEIREDSENSGSFGGTDNKVDEDVVSSVNIGGIENDLDDDVLYSFLFGGDLIDLDEGASSSGIAGGLDMDIDEDATNSLILGGAYQNIDDDSDNSVIFAGEDNYWDEQSDFSVSMAGFDHDIYANYNATVGGESHTFTSSTNRSVLFGGSDHGMRNTASAALGGNLNTLRDPRNIIIGGSGNDTDDSNASSIFGDNNEVNGNSDYSIVGGSNSDANEVYQIALGRDVKGQNNDDNAVLFGDSNTDDLVSSNDDEWRNRFSGGYRLYTNSGLSTGVRMEGNQSSWTTVSDSTKKQTILELDYRQVYNEIQSLGIYSWNYIGSEIHQRNYSPMAQEFYSLFGNDAIGYIGTDTTINELDLTSVFLAGIRGSFSNLEIMEVKLKSVEQQPSTLESRLESIRNRLNGLKID